MATVILDCYNSLSCTKSQGLLFRTIQSGKLKMEINSAKYSDMTTDWYERKVVFGLKSSNHSHSKHCGRGCSYEAMSVGSNTYTCPEKVDRSWCFPLIPSSGQHSKEKVSLHLSNSLT